MSKRSAQRKRAANKELAEANAELAAERRFTARTAPPVPAPPMTPAQTLEAVAEIVERGNADGSSQQPRFNNDAEGVFRSVYNWVKVAALKGEPGPNAAVKEWDGWLREFVLQEPYLVGVLNSVVQIDKNRGWSFVGGRNQVLRYSNILHGADAGAGWRAYLTWQAQSFYTTRMGFVTEVGRDGENGPLRALYSVDPARVELTTDPSQPLRYMPASGPLQIWQPQDYFRAASLTSTDERKMGYGFPANARCFELAKIMVAIWEHDKEQLGARAPRGLLLLNGISQKQWENAMQAREENLNAQERQYYGSVAILASSGQNEVDAKLFALSQLPKDFTLREWVSLLMYGYALAYGYDAREFFPVDSGSLGSAKETEVQHRKASSKGDLDFSLAHQEQLQAVLPETLHFEYEQRDASGEALDAALATSQATLITEISKWAVNGQTVLTQEQILALAAEARIIPEEWTVQEEDITVDDSGDETERALELYAVQRSLAVQPDEPIVQYDGKARRMRTLYVRRSRPKYYALGDGMERTAARVAAAFQRDLQAIVDAFWDGDGDLRIAEVRQVVGEAIQKAYMDELRAAGIPTAEITEEEIQQAEGLTLQAFEYLPDFIRAVRAAKKDPTKQDGISARIELWGRTVLAAGTSATNAALANEMAEFAGEDGDESCATCIRLKGTRHRRRWWEEHGLVPGQPGNTNFECGGYRCQHVLVSASQRSLAVRSASSGRMLPAPTAPAVPATGDSALLRELVLALAQQRSGDGLGVKVFETLLGLMQNIQEKVVTPQVIKIEPTPPQVIHVSPQEHAATARALQDLAETLRKDKTNAQTISILQRVVDATKHSSDTELRAIRELAQSITRQAEQPITVNVSPTPITVTPAPVKVVVSFPRRMREIFDIIRNGKGQTAQIIKTSESSQE